MDTLVSFPCELEADICCKIFMLIVGCRGCFCLYLSLCISRKPSSLLLNLLDPRGSQAIAVELLADAELILLLSTFPRFHQTVRLVPIVRRFELLSRPNHTPQKPLQIISASEENLLTNRPGCRTDLERLHNPTVDLQVYPQDKGSNGG